MNAAAPDLAREIEPDGALRQDMALLRHALQPHAPAEDVLLALAASAAVLKVEPGPVLHPHPALPTPSLWLLRHGRMAIGILDRQRRFAESRRAVAGQWIDVFGALCRPPRWFHELRAMGRCELLAIPLAEVLRAMAIDGNAAAAFSNLLASEALRLRDDLRQQRQLPLGARVAQRLLDATAGAGDEPAAATWLMDIPKQHLAQQLGASKEALSRMLRTLSDAGLIRVQGYAVTVLDRAGLARIAQPAAPRRGVRRPMP